MEVFIKDEDKNKYESFALSGYYHTFRLGDEIQNKLFDLFQADLIEKVEE